MIIKHERSRASYEIGRDTISANATGVEYAIKESTRGEPRPRRLFLTYSELQMLVDDAALAGIVARVALDTRLT